MNMNMNPSDSDLRDWILGRSPERHLLVSLPETRDLSAGTATAGGSTVPAGFASMLHEHMIETAVIRQTNVTVLRTESGGDINVPKTTAHGTAALVAEGATITEADPTFAAVTLQAFKYAVMIQVSTELINDSGVDLVGYLARQAGRAIGNASGGHFITGDGSEKPNGIVTKSTLGVTGGTGQTGAPTADELINLHFSVIPEYRRAGTWIMSDATWAGVRKLKDKDDMYLIDRLVSGGELTLLGRHRDRSEVGCVRRLLRVLHPGRPRAARRAVRRLRVQPGPGDVPGAVAHRR